MKEKIILAPGANPTELMRTLARKGKNTLGIRIMSPGQLADYLLMKNGIASEGTYISSSEEAVIYADFLKNGVSSYFKTASYADAVNMATAIDSARNLIPTNEKEVMKNKLSGGEFPQKNSALLTAYEYYINTLEKENKTDTIREIRKAIDSVCKAVGEYITLKEFPLTPLEKKLIETASDDDYKELSLCEFAELEETPAHIEKYVRAYGASNEAEWIISEILENNIPVDSCTVAVADNPQYSQIFYDLCTLYDIPVTFGCGIPVSNSNPAAILVLLNKLSTSGAFGIDAFRELFSSAAFDKNKLRERLKGIYYFDALSKAVGNLRISFDSETNKEKISAYESCQSLTDEDLEMIENIKVIADEFGKGPSYIISEYSVIRKGPEAKYDLAALRSITDMLDTYLSHNEGGSIEEILPRILSKQICAENSKEGCLFVTVVGSAINSIRENLFVAGMSAVSFPGSPKENYLLLDSDYLMFGDFETVPGSEKSIKDKIESAKNLVSFASSCKNRLIMSFSNFNLAEIKESNPSSLLFDLFAAENGSNSTVDDFNSSLVNVGFFEKNLGIDAGIGREYKSGRIVSAVDISVENSPVSYSGDRIFSPSSIETFINCPRKFYLTKILGMPDISEDDPNTVVAANDFGTLVHEMMESLAEDKPSKEEFLEKGKKHFEEFLASRPPVSQTDVENELNEYLDCLSNGYDSDTGGTVITAEEKMTVNHPSGISVRGIPDRIERVNGIYTVVDYKTGRTVKHEKNDPTTCIQTLLYAYMIHELKDIPVSKCEYRYLRSDVVVRCEYNPEMAKEVDEHLYALAKALDTMNFPAETDCSACKYCNLKKVCGADDTEVEDDE